MLNLAVKSSFEVENLNEQFKIQTMNLGGIVRHTHKLTVVEKY